MKTMKMMKVILSDILDLILLPFTCHCFICGARFRALHGDELFRKLSHHMVVVHHR
jgi:hypothetical protein